MLVAAAALCGTVGAQPPAGQPLDIDADSWAIDREATTFRGLRAVSGELSVRADDAVAAGLDYGASQWTLRGNVRIATDLGVIEADEASGSFAEGEWRFSGGVAIRVGTALLQADQGRFTFRADQLAAAELTGTPAVFEDRSAPGLEDRGPVRGTADRLLYDAGTETLRLTDNVTVRAGPNEYSGCDLVYDFGREGVTAGSSEHCGEPLHIRIQVPAGEDAEPPPAP